MPAAGLSHTHSLASSLSGRRMAREMERAAWLYRETALLRMAFRALRLHALHGVLCRRCLHAFTPPFPIWLQTPSSKLSPFPTSPLPCWHNLNCAVRLRVTVQQRAILRRAAAAFREWRAVAHRAALLRAEFIHHWHFLVGAANYAPTISSFLFMGDRLISLHLLAPTPLSHRDTRSRYAVTF